MMTTFSLNLSTKLSNKMDTKHGNKKNLLINSFLLFNCNCNLKKSKLNYKTDSIDIAA